MSKRILVACILALFGAWLSLVILGRKIIPSAPVSIAWIVPLGANGWEYAMKEIAKAEATDANISRGVLTELLGEPDNISASFLAPENTYLHYTNYHDDSLEVVFIVDSEGTVTTVASRSKIPAPLGADQ